MDVAGVGLSLTLMMIVGLTALAVLWVLVPFAVFGVKPLLRQLIDEQRRTRAAIEALAKPPGI